MDEPIKRKRRDTPPGEFRDPLSDYSPPDYADEMERALCEDSVVDIGIRPFITIPPQTAIEAAVRKMAELDVACLMIAEGDRLEGILSERDLLRVAEKYEQIKNRPVREIMTPNPVIAHSTDSPAKALNQMAVGGFRHIPVLDVDEKIVGIVGPRRATAYLQHQLDVAI